MYKILSSFPSETVRCPICVSPQNPSFRDVKCLDCAKREFKFLLLREVDEQIQPINPSQLENNAHTRAYHFFDWWICSCSNDWLIGKKKKKWHHYLFFSFSLFCKVLFSLRTPLGSNIYLLQIVIEYDLIEGLMNWFTRKREMTIKIKCMEVCII